MKAAVLNQIPGELVVEDVTVDKPKGNEVLIQTLHAGLCHSDLHFMEGHWSTKLPAVMGHESAGIVQAVGPDVTYCKPGDRVITCLSLFCGHCDMCLTGHPNVCRNNRALDRAKDDTPRLTNAAGEGLAQFARLGGFAEEMLIHENAVVKVREEMPLDKASLIGCGVTTGVGAVFRTAKIEPGSTVVIIGCGGIGLKQTAEQAWAVTGLRGTAVIVGMMPFDAKVEIPGYEIFMQEKTLKGSMMGSNVFRRDMPQYVNMYLDGRLNLDDMVSRHIHLDQINEGYEAMQRREGTRTVIDFD